MKAPDYSRCTAEELWKFVSWHLSKHGIETVLVGGAVASIYSKGAYLSGDLDLVKITDVSRKIITDVLGAIGFKTSQGRHFEHPECRHLFIEFVAPPVAIGDDYLIKPDEVRISGQIIKILNPTDCIKDRLASFIHFKSHECMDQALLVAKSQSFDIKKIEKWCKGEGPDGMLAFKQFRDALK